MEILFYNLETYALCGLVENNKHRKLYSYGFYFEDENEIKLRKYIINENKFN